MKKLFFLLAIGIFSIASFAQDNTAPAKIHIREAGIGFTNFNSFNFLFKVGTQKSLWRFSLLAGDGTNEKQETDNETAKNYNYQFGINAGHEFRAGITKNLEFRYGLDLNFKYQIAQNQSIINSGLSPITHTLNISTFSPGLNFVLGFNYVIKDSFVIGVEALPYFSYEMKTEKSKMDNPESQPTETKVKTNNLSFGLSNTSVLVSLAYRF